MKILHLTKKYPNAMGGDAVYVANLEKYQRISGHQVFILTSNCKEIVTRDNVFKFGLKDRARNWDKIGFKRLISMLMLIFYFPYILKKIRPDVIHAHSVELGFIACLWVRIFKVPVVLTCHSILFPYRDCGFFRRVVDFILLKLSSYKEIITVDTESLGDFKRLNFKDCIFIPTGVDLDLFNFGEAKGKNGKIKFLFVGRLEKIKGLNLLFQSINLIAGRCRDFEVLIVGEGSEEENLRRLSKELNIESFVSFLGPVYNSQVLIDLYRSCDIFILPSLREWCPLVIFEAWASSLALIATKTGSIAKICTHLEDSYIIRPGDVNDLQQAMLDLIQNSDLRNKLAKSGRRLVEKQYNWHILNSEIGKVYTNILK
ncbi:MAG: glycosyltransferase family 4 protein [Candidatus Omnitrophota bacterium]